MHVPRSHQSRPLFLLNGRSGIVSGDCSSGATTARLGEELRHAHWISATHLHYPPTRAIDWWSASKRREIANSIVSQIRAQSGFEPVDIVAHSMGCDIIREVEEITEGMEFRRIVLIAPAMSHRYDWTQHDFERMLVIRNPGDRAILWGAMLPGHRFGWAGRRGFEITDSRMHDMVIEDVGRLDKWRHSHFFRSWGVVRTGLEVDDFLTED